MRGKAMVLGAWMLLATFGAAGLIPGAQLAPVATAAAPEGGFAVPVGFEPNVGQAREGAYLARGEGYAVFLDSAGAVFDLAGQGQVARVRMTFPGADPATLVPGGPAPGKSNYYVGGDAAGWLPGVPRHAGVTLQGLWPGVDLVFHGAAAGSDLEYDFVLAPGTDPARIAMTFHGGEVAIGPDGALRIAAPTGELQHRAPVVYQERDGARVPVAGAYRLLGPGTVGFEVGPHDPAMALVIDPILLYSQSLGGSVNASIPSPPGLGNGYDSASAVTIDTFGNLYVLGMTTSVNFPVLNPWQDVRAGFSDVFLAKFDPFGVYQWGTYVGGSQNNTYHLDTTERGGITVDPAGNVFAVTSAHYIDFPMVGPSYQGANAGSWDAAIMRVDPSGQMVQSTWFGSTGAELATGIGRDAAGNIYVGGVASGGALPTTTGAIQPGRAGGDEGWVAKFDPTLTQLLYCTYFGGTLDDRLRGLSVDAAGNAYIAGTTTSTDMPRANAAQNAKSFYNDAFAAKLAPDGRSLVYSTYYGAASYDYANAVAHDALGNAYITGQTDSTGLVLPPSPPPAQLLNAGGQYDAFLAKFGPTGALLYGTYIGGAYEESGTAVSVDAKERAVVVGWTNSWNFPVKFAINDWVRTTNDTFSPSLGRPLWDTFITRIDTKAATPAAALAYSTYFGAVGNHDWANAVAVDGPGNIYVAGEFAPGAFPLANNTVPVVPGSAGYNAYVAAFIQSCGAKPVTSAAVTSGLAGNAGWWRSNVVVTLTATSTSCPVPYTFYRVDGGPQIQGRLVPVAGDLVHTLRFQSRDILGGLESPEVAFTVKIDTTPPVTTPTYVGSPGVGCWFRSPVAVTLNAADAMSGPAPGETYYSLNGSVPVKGKTLTIAVSGIHSLRYNSTDVAGNIEAIKASSVCIDYVPPVVDLQRPTNGSVYALDIEDPLRPGLPVTAALGTLQVRAEASDDFSGVERVELWVDDELRLVDRAGPYVFDWETGAEVLGEHVVRAVAYDMAGNTNVSAATILTIPTRHTGILATLADAGAPLPPMPLAGDLDPWLRAALLDLEVAMARGDAAAPREVGA